MTIFLPSSILQKLSRGKMDSGSTLCWEKTTLATQCLLQKQNKDL